MPTNSDIRAYASVPARITDTVARVRERMMPKLCEFRKKRRQPQKCRMATRRKFESERVEREIKRGVSTNEIAFRKSGLRAPIASAHQTVEAANRHCSLRLVSVMDASALGSTLIRARSTAWFSISHTRAQWARRRASRRRAQPRTANHRLCRALLRLRRDLLCRSIRADHPFLL